MSRHSLNYIIVHVFNIYTNKIIMKEKLLTLTVEELSRKFQYIKYSYKLHDIYKY